jgi:hypothetical protein
VANAERAKARCGVTPGRGVTVPWADRENAVINNNSKNRLTFPLYA